MPYMQAIVVNKCSPEKILENLDCRDYISRVFIMEEVSKIIIE